ncbi:hypothetical protein SDC9_52055 [bioreactor metagenome]|uniref:Putative Flp pilus-assembly TadG-like N-terminal domain-containing protein n=1 Tax=bioreactor metagenome TaxID=1076179 RepID=A0A644WPL7_9ZZZZ
MMKMMIMRLIRMNELRKYLNKFCCEQRGSVAVITAMAMVALLGISALVLDIGVSYNEASKLQNALDSAALAAVCELPAENSNSASWAAAKHEAISLAAANDCSLSPEDVQPIYKDNVTTNKIIGIKVTKSIVVKYNFAQVIGIDSGTITRTASAGLTPVSGVTGAVPLCISYSSLSNAIAANATAGLIIKCSSNTGDIGIDCTGLSGWFAALRFDGNGASIFSDLIANGYQGDLRIGQVINTESGNMSGPTMDGFTTRVAKCTDGCTASCYEPNCPRLVNIPVIEIVSNNEVRIVSFATFFVLECGGSGKDAYIKATYIKNSVLSDSVPGAAGQDCGLYVRRLLN